MLFTISLIVLLIWQIFSGNAVYVMGATISREKDPLFYWFLVGGESIALLIVILKRLEAS